MSLVSCLPIRGMLQQRRWASKQAKDGLVPVLASTGKSRQTAEEQPSSAPSSRRVGGKKSSLDDFFANLGSVSGNNRQTNRRIKRDRMLSSSLTMSKSGVETGQKVDMVSFFENVNKIMESNKKDAALVQSETKSGLKHITTTSSSSMLDNLLPPAHIRRPDSYDRDAFDLYVLILDTCIDDAAFARRTRKSMQLDESEVKSVVDWLLAEQPTVKYNLPTLAMMLNADTITRSEESTLRKSLLQELDDQRTKFLDHLGWNKRQFELAMRGLQRLGHLCAKRATGPPAEIGWEKLKEAGLGVGKDLVQTYLYVTSTFSAPSDSLPCMEGASLLDLLGESPTLEKREVHGTGLQQERMMEGIIETATEVALVHDILFGASEQSTSIRVRRLVSQKKPAEAENLLESNAVSRTPITFLMIRH